MGVRIEPMTLSDLADVLAEHDRFWDGRDVRFLHQRVFVQEFGETCLTARGEGGRIAGYLLGFTTPHRVGYIHAVAVRDDARGTGCAQTLYAAFAAVATAQGAERLKAITTETNAGSVAFHRRLGFDVRQVDDYSGPGIARIVMTRPLPLPRSNWTSPSPPRDSSTPGTIRQRPPGEDPLAWKICDDIRTKFDTIRDHAFPDGPEPGSSATEDR